MPDQLFPPLPLDQWQPTRDTLHAYTQVISRIRRSLTPPQKHWWHISLHAAASGLTSTPVPFGQQTFEMLLDFTHHRVLLTTSRGPRRDLALSGQSQFAFKNQTLELLADLGIYPEIDPELFTDDTQGAYDKAAVSAFWQALSQIDAAFKQFGHGFRTESSPVQFWSHHFDLSVLWFSGRLVPGQDPNNPEWSDEQMNFGFSTGDEGIPEPYFYATAYPVPEGWTASELPPGAFWQTSGWTGAALPYAELTTGPDPRLRLLNFLRTVQEAGAAHMS